MNKKNIAILVVACGIAAFLLTWVTGHVLSKYTFGSIDYYYEGSDTYSVGNAELSPEQIRSIEINWLEGNVSLKSWDGQTFKIEEETSPSDPDDRVHYHLNDSGNLQIKFFSSRQQSGIYRKAAKKDISILIPRELAATEIQINVTAGDIICDKLVQADKLFVSTEAGNCRFTECEAGRLFCDVSAGSVSDSGSSFAQIEIGTAAGSLELLGKYEQVTAGTNTGACVLNIDSGLASADIKVDAGSIRIIAPDDGNFTARYLVDEGMTDFGSFNVEKISSGEAKCGNGSAQLKLSVQTGSISFVRSGEN